MPYTPKPGSKCEKGYQFVLKMGTARSAEIAANVGVPTSQVMSLLSSAVAKGALICCKVEQPGKDPTIEYRVSGGMPPAPFVELKRPTQQRAPQPAVSKNTGSASSASLLPGFTEGRAVAPEAPKPTPKPRELGPAAREASARNEIRLSIDDSARLSITLADGQSDPLRLTPEETLALGDFLVCTEQLWRP